MAQGKIIMKVRRLRGRQRQQQATSTALAANESGSSSIPPVPVINGTPKTVELIRGDQVNDKSFLRNHSELLDFS